MKLLSYIAFGALTAVAFTASAQTQSQSTTSSSAAQTSGSTSQAQLLSSRDITGRTVIDKDGNSIGNVEFLTIGLKSGAISNVVIKPSGNAQQSVSAQQNANQQSNGAQQGDLIIVPWRNTTLTNSQVRVDATRQKVLSGPKLQRKDLAQLTQPAASQSVIDYWAPASEVAALKGGDSTLGTQSNQTAQSATQSDTTTSGTYSPSGTSATSGTSSRIGTMDHDRDYANANGNASSNTSNDMSARGTSDNAPDVADGMVLVGREIVSVVTGPAFQLSNDLRGANVNDSSGKRIGTIDTLMIDKNAGSVAYALIDRQGTGQGNAPIPLQALTWTSKDNTYRFSGDVASLEPNQTLTAAGQKTVSRDALDELYQQFDVQPYWQRTSSR